MPQYVKIKYNRLQKEAPFLKKINVKTVKDIFIILLFSFLLMFLFSESSPIYAINRWVDPHYFFTVGKGIVKGVVPYKDLYEQKGPVLYFLCAGAYLISNDTFLGMFIIEFICASISLILIYKHFKLFSDDKICIKTIIAAIFIYINPAFKNGFSAEEICLPMLLFMSYLSIRFIVKGIYISNKNAFVIGITSGMVLLIKYTMLGFYLGVLIAIASILRKQKKLKKLIPSICFILFGIAVVATPIILYFVKNNALSDFFEDYFINNICGYTNVESNSSGIFTIIRNLVFGLVIFIISHPVALFLFIMGLVIIIKNKNKILSQYILISFVTTYIITFIGGKFFVYYYFPFGLFIPVSLSYISEEFKHYKYKTKMIFIALFFVVFMCSSLPPIIGRMQFITVKKENLPQYKCKTIIEDSQIDNPVILNYAYYDLGLYTVCDVVPSYKFFCIFNVDPYGNRAEQDKYIEEGNIDFIITTEEVTDEQYKLIDEEKNDKIYEFTFRLYTKKQ